MPAQAGIQLPEGRWLAAWRALGVQPTPELGRTHRDLVAAYREPHRHYHTPQHLSECFERFDEIALLAGHPAEIEIALWFHDAIYDTRRSDNEARSVEWARRCARTTGVDASAIGRIEALILATRHAALPASRDERVLVDVDLSILGAGAARFAEYEEQVRAEYAWVPRFLYRRKRRQVLKEFLDRPRLYSTPALFERLESTARRNLAASLARLGG